MTAMMIVATTMTTVVVMIGATVTAATAKSIAHLDVHILEDYHAYLHHRLVLTLVCLQFSIGVSLDVSITEVS